MLDHLKDLYRTGQVGPRPPAPPDRDRSSYSARQHLRIFRGDDGLVRIRYAAPYGSRSKTGDPKCSDAASAWARRKATAETFKELARCRSLGGAQKKAQALRGAGQEARAQHLEHRIAGGKPLTAKARAEEAKKRLAERAAKGRAGAAQGVSGSMVPTAPAPGPSEEIKPGVRERIEKAQASRAISPGERARIAGELRAERRGEVQQPEQKRPPVSAPSAPSPAPEAESDPHERIRQEAVAAAKRYHKFRDPADRVRAEEWARRYMEATGERDIWQSKAERERTQAEARRKPAPEGPFAAEIAEDEAMRQNVLAAQAVKAGQASFVGEKPAPGPKTAADTPGAARFTGGRQEAAKGQYKRILAHMAGTGGDRAKLGADAANYAAHFGATRPEVMQDMMAHGASYEEATGATAMLGGGRLPRPSAEPTVAPSATAPAPAKPTPEAARERLAGRRQERAKASTPEPPTLAGDELRRQRAEHPTRPLPHYEADVEASLRTTGHVPEGFLEKQRERIRMHRGMGFTPEESASELMPFLEAARKPRYDTRGELKAIARMGEEAARERLAERAASRAKAQATPEAHRSAVLEHLRRKRRLIKERTQTAPATPEAHRSAVLEHLRRQPKGSLVPIGDIKAAFPGREAAIEDALMDLAEKGQINLHQHDYPAGLSEYEKGRVMRRRGKTYIGAGLRQTNL